MFGSSSSSFIWSSCDVSCPFFICSANDAGGSVPGAGGGSEFPSAFDACAGGSVPGAFDVDISICVCACANGCACANDE